MIRKFLEQTSFRSYKDFMEHFRVNVPEHFNFAYDVIDAYAETQPQKEAILYTNDEGDVRHLTYGEYKMLSDEVASYLHALHIVRGDRVMLILKRRLEWWITMAALHKIGAVAIPATHLLTSKDIIFRCHEADIKAIITVGETTVLKNVISARPFCPSVEQCISIGPEVPQNWKNLWQGAAMAPPFKSQKGENEKTDNFLMYFTSGTTGKPKMVMHDFSYPLAHIVTAAYWHNVNPKSVHLTVADTGWGKAVWGKFYGQMICGATVFVYDFDGHFDPVKLLDKMQEYHITSFCAPPTVYRFLVREDLSKWDLSSLEYCTTAGEALHSSVFKEWKEKTGITIYEGYGQTETTLVLSNYCFVRPKPGSLGLPNPQFNVDVLDDDGQPVGPGVHGRLVIRTGQQLQKLKGIGGNELLQTIQKNIHSRVQNIMYYRERPLGLFKEYYRNPELTRRARHNRVYYTGDIVWYDEDGYFWFVARADDIIKSSGYRIDPFEVESALMSHEAVLECAITGEPDSIRGMVVKATVVLTSEFKQIASSADGREALTRELQSHVKRETAPYKYPRIVEFVDELPKTISGKIRRSAIRNHESTPPQTPSDGKE